MVDKNYMAPSLTVALLSGKVCVCTSPEAGCIENVEYENWD